MSEQIIVNPEAPVHLAVSDFDSHVVLHFSRATEFVALTPKDALALGPVLMDKAYQVSGELKPADGAVKHELIERHRRTLTRRFELVMNTQRERKRVSNPALAKQLIDICLSEIFT